MRIQHNIMAMNAYRNYTNNVSAMKKNLERLSSGYKINRAGDDAAGLAISEKMRAQITGLETAQKNAKDGISLVQTAEGALTEVHDMLNRMVELATQSANGTYDNDTDRYQLQKELNQLLDEIDRIADSSNFNGINLLDGSLGMNTKAFELMGSTNYVKAGNGSKMSLAGIFLKSTAHGQKAEKAQPPKFSIDLSKLQIQANEDGEATFNLKVGNTGIDLEVTLESDAESGMAAADPYAVLTIGQIMKAVSVAMADEFDDVDATMCVSIGGAYFKVTLNMTTGIIDFEFFSIDEDATATAAWSLVGGATLADTINGKMQGQVTVTVQDGEGTLVNSDNNHSYVCDIYAIQDAVAGAGAENWGVDLDLTQLVKDGYKLVIGQGSSARTYIFQTDADSDIDPGDAILIDVSMFTSGKVTQAARMLAGGVATDGGKLTGHAGGKAQIFGDYTISYMSGGKIHIDIKPDSDTAKKIETADDMKKLFTAYKAGKPAEAASTKLKVTDSEIKEGNILVLDEDHKITFESGDTIDDVIEKIKAEGYDVEQDEKDQNVLVISAKNATATTPAPSILGKGLTLQIGDTSDSWNQLTVGVKDCHASAMGVGELDISTEQAAQAAVSVIKDAINYVSDIRGTLGATQNRLDHTINNLSVMTENIQDAESTIRDTDIAEEMMAYTKNNILIQSAQAMLAQANQVPQGVLQLLQ